MFINLVKKQTSINISRRMFKDTQLITHFRLPMYPPSGFIITLFLINLFICFIAHNHMVFRLFCFIYSSLMLYRLHNVLFYLKITTAINIFIIFLFLSGNVLSRGSENLIFCIFLILFSKKIMLAIIGTFRSVFLFMKPVQFDDIFWIVQIGLLAEYFNYFAQLKILRFLPSFLRVIQSLRGGNRSSYMSALRYSTHFMKQIFAQYTIGWIIFSIFVSTWEVYNNYWNQFGIERLFKSKGSVCLYPRKVIWYGFIATSIFQWSWIVPGRHVGITSMLRKILWNYMRVQYRLAEMYKKYVIMSMLDIDPQYLNDLVN